MTTQHFTIFACMLFGRKYYYNSMVVCLFATKMSIDISGGIATKKKSRSTEVLFGGGGPPSKSWNFQCGMEQLGWFFGVKRNGKEIQTRNSRNFFFEKNIKKERNGKENRA